MKSQLFHPQPITPEFIKLLSFCSALQSKQAIEHASLAKQVLLTIEPRNIYAIQYRKRLFDAGKIQLGEELDFVENSLTQESRNFSMWEYFKHLARVSQRPLFKQAQKLIRQDYLNSFAWQFLTFLTTLNPSPYYLLTFTRQFLQQVDSQCQACIQLRATAIDLKDTVARTVEIAFIKGLLERQIDNQPLWQYLSFLIGEGEAGDIGKWIVGRASEGVEMAVWVGISKGLIEKENIREILLRVKQKGRRMKLFWIRLLKREGLLK